jgi:hypothetical protein
MIDFPRRRMPAPTDICAYFDMIQVWVREPLDHGRLAWLRGQCGRRDRRLRGGLHVQTRPARFDRNYRQLLQLRQPKAPAFRWLAGREDALINRAEITLDLTFESNAERDDAQEFVHQHLVRRWHGRRQEIRINSSDNDTRYDAGRGAPNRMVIYDEDHCRITGELHCLHIEWRVKGAKAVRSAGIESPRDLIGFNHHRFWQRRLLLYEADLMRLGRLIRNHRSGARSRSSNRRDQITGEILVRRYDTVQELIDHLKETCRVHSALVRIPNDQLLPPDMEVEW